jgi:hypothetical protein
MSDDFFKGRRVLPPDYPQQVRERIKNFFGWTDAEFEAEMKKLRRPIDDPRCTPSKRAIFETIRQVCEEEGVPFWPGDREPECVIPPELINRARALVEGVEIDLDAPLPPDDVGSATWLICHCGRLSIAASPGEDGADTCLCGRPAAEMTEATRAQIDSVPNGVTINVVSLNRSE